MKKIKPENSANAKKLLCDWTDKMNYLIHYRMLIFYVTLGMIVDKNHEINSYKQSKWLEKNLILVHIREIRLKKILKKTFGNYSTTFFMERQWKIYEID